MRTFSSLLIVAAFFFQGKIQKKMIVVHYLRRSLLVNASTIHKRDAAFDVKACSASLGDLLPIFDGFATDVSVER